MVRRYVYRRRFLDADQMDATCGKAVGAMSQVLQEHDLETLERLIAFVLASSRATAFRRCGYKTSADACACNLFTQESCSLFTDHEDDKVRELPHHAPGSDHTDTAWKDGKARAFLLQPSEFSWRDLTEIVEWCKQHKLRASISSGGSWQFPGRSLLVTIVPDECDELELPRDLMEAKDHPRPLRNKASRPT